MSNSKALFGRPASAYYLILGSVVALSALGLVMVLSASSVKSLSESGNSFAYVLRQAMFLTLSVAIAWVAMKLRAELWKPIARTALLASCLLLILPQIPGVGKTVGGNTNWIGSEASPFSQANSQRLESSSGVRYGYEFMIKRRVKARQVTLQNLSSLASRWLWL